MKKIIITLALAAMSCAAFAQNFGVKVGANLSNINGISDDTKSLLGCYIGGVAEIGLPVANLGLRLEPAYSMQGYKADVTLLGVTTKTNVYADYINLPILAEYKLLGGDLALMVGPQVGMNLGMSSKTTIGDNDPTNYTYDSDKYNTVDFGVTFGATYMVTGNVGIDLRYNLGLSNIFPETSITDPFGNNRVLSIGACYMF